jgi:hypothetical protein
MGLQHRAGAEGIHAQLKPADSRYSRCRRGGRATARVASGLADARLVLHCRTRSDRCVGGEVGIVVAWTAGGWRFPSPAEGMHLFERTSGT